MLAKLSRNGKCGDLLRSEAGRGELSPIALYVSESITSRKEGAREDISTWMMLTDGGDEWTFQVCQEAHKQIALF